jgi:hypothetical protein
VLVDGMKNWEVKQFLLMAGDRPINEVPKRYWS